MIPKNHLNCVEESLVYPGVYIPLKNKPGQQTFIKPCQDKRRRFPKTRVRELPDSYIVETSLASAKREDFLVRAFGNQITIDVKIKVPSRIDPDADQEPESEFLHYSRKVVLPEDADTGFVSAEYNLGVLRFYIPKIIRPVEPRQSIIVIY